MADTLRVTEHSRFLVCRAPGETRYYADTPTNKVAARDLDERGDPVAIQGFGVYDTSISTTYAVAVYGSKAEALTHMASDAPEPAESVFDESEYVDPPADDVDTDLPEIPPSGDGAEATDPGYAEGHPAESYRKPKRPKR